MMKKVFSLTLSLALLCLVFAGCGKKSSSSDAKNSSVADASESSASGRLLYKNGLNDYVKLGEYKGLTVDTASSDYKEAFDSLAQSDAEEKELYTQKTGGTVQNGDIANIDYVGKKDGVAFDGGTAQGYDLTIGSGSFIPGFEEGLVGKAIGSTVDLDLTFPEEYHSADLAGQAVVFTVKINYVKTAMGPDESYAQLGFESADAYKKDLDIRASKQVLMNTVGQSSEIKDYPEEDLNYLYNQQMNQINQSLKQQGADLATYLKQYGETEEEFKKEVKEYLKSLMKSQMIAYAVFDKAELSLEKKQSDWQAETEAVQTAVENYLYENAQKK